MLKLDNQMKPVHYTVASYLNSPMYAFIYADNIGGSSSPWLVLEYLPNGDLKSFLMVYYYIAMFCFKESYT